MHPQLAGAPGQPSRGSHWLEAAVRGTLCAVRTIVTLWLLGSLGLPACKDHAPSPAEIADRGWHAHELVVAAGERAATCAQAGVEMQRVFVAHRQDFVDAIALDRDKERLAEATAFLEAHQDRYADLETRMVALADRCADDATVQAAFQQMETP